ncbi:hypothetical protein BC628DRAFT_1050262 [Trametes gibbosa]|nr:hypothetical protein BC628DRAFT_1050262 [Trametes gibbosa]
MQEDESFVPTSDQEELEELAATDVDYWTTSTCDIARRRGALSLPAEIFHVPPVLAPSPRRSHWPSSRSPSFDQRPTKRRKPGTCRHRPRRIQMLSLILRKGEARALLHHLQTPSCCSHLHGRQAPHQIPGRV